MKKRWMKLLAVAIWLAIWFIAAIVINDSFKFPGPVETLKALLGNIISGDGFFRTVLTSLLRILLGLAGSFILGLVLGVTAGIKKGLA